MYGTMISREAVLAAVKRDGTALEFAADALKADKEVVLAAVKNHGFALDWASDALQADKEVVLAAVKNHGFALCWASDALQADKEVVLAAVKCLGYALCWASDALRADKEVVLAALKQSGYALEWASDALRADKDVVLAAVRHDGFAALQWDYDALQHDALLRRLSKLSGRVSDRGRRNWHVFKVKFAIRAVVAYWSMLAGKDEAYFDDDGVAVMQGSDARAAKRSWEEMMAPTK